MSRVDELQKKYPSVPREVIVRLEIVNRGVRDTDGLDKASEWTAAAAYQNKYDDVTVKEMVEKRPSRLSSGRMLRPGVLFMKNGLAAEIRINPKSPYEIIPVGEGKFALCEGEEKVDVDVYFPQPEPRQGPEPLTSRGTPVSRLMTSPRNCFFIMPVRYCEYFSLGDQCKFCNFNSGQDDARSLGLDRPVAENLEDTVEAYKIRSSEVSLLEGRFALGGFLNAENEERIHCSFVEKIANAAPYKPNFTVHTEAMTRKGMQRLKDAGLDCMTIQLEVWEPRLFAEVLPGKSKHCSYERWLESLSDAVDVFGVGNVACKTIGGLTLIPSNGHKTWQEARDSHIEAVRWMVKNGMLPNVGHLGLPAGSIYGEDPSNREKLPPTEYHLDVALAHHEAMMEHGLYHKLNKFMYCGLDSMSGNYAGELGILALAGDVGNWMADVVPEEANWLAKFISLVRSPAAIE